ncbi:MAG: 30S ribosome-binding factor RbfA, partial [Firmicutes bacterium]|nr:30S ribosome-binding factor RbfA [Bacillota bacterium]
MGKSHRPQRMGEEMRKILSDMLMRGALKDPGFSEAMISVNAVEVTNEGGYARVDITALGCSGAMDEQRKKEILAAFEHSKGHIRTEIGKNLKARHVPELIFKYAESLDYGAKMDSILDKIEIPADDY